MVAASPNSSATAHVLSVLALSSRFDGLRPIPNPSYRDLLSVLALSSRFDGQISLSLLLQPGLDFQYSLCRVVLMVLDTR